MNHRIAYRCFRRAMANTVGVNHVHERWTHRRNLVNDLGNTGIALRKRGDKTGETRQTQGKHCGKASRDVMGPQETPLQSATVNTGERTTET